jgi:hypothetical protein
MEPNFQTSFIPKKPMIEERISSSHSIGLFTVIAIFIFFTVLIASGGLYFYKQLLNRNILSMRTSLNTAKAEFETSSIVRMQILDNRLKAADEILSRHISVRPIFDILQRITMKTVQYTTFSYDLGADKDTMVAVRMRGLAVGYRDVALQSDLFDASDELIDPVFSNLTPDTDGNIAFDLEFMVERDLINYKETLKTGGFTPNSNFTPTNQGAPVNPPANNPGALPGAPMN